MDHLEFTLPGGNQRPKSGKHCALTGVVSSSNLEVLVEMMPLNGQCRLIVDTTVPGFSGTWQAVFADFIARNGAADVQFSVNDFGAIPPVVSLRLDQAWEALNG